MKWWRRFVAIQIKLWHALLVFAICLGAVVGGISALGSETEEAISAQEIQTQLAIERANLQEQISKLEQHDAAICEYMLREIEGEERAIERLDMEIDKLYTTLLTLYGYVPKRLWQAEENNLNTLYEQRIHRQGRISAYQSILKTFYEE